MNRYTVFFAAYNRSVKQGNNRSRQDVIADFTGGRTQSLKDLTDGELNELCRRLNAVNPKPQYDAKADKMRKAIIAIFHQMNRKPADAIAWAEKQGVNGVKKRFNSYSNQELYKLIIVAEKVQRDWEAGVRRGLRRVMLRSSPERNDSGSDE